MDDPTGELRRQREIIAAHLRWLDAQIARTQGPASAAGAPAPEAAAPSTPVHPAATTADIPAARQILAGTAAAPEIDIPEIDPGSIRNEVRRGCFIYIVGVTVLLAASVALAVWIAGK